jgi:hypothetical protein
VPGKRGRGGSQAQRQGRAVPRMAERGVRVAHSTILRWVTRYVPEFEKRWNRFSKAVGTSWRVESGEHEKASSRLKSPALHQNQKVSTSIFCVNYSNDFRQ